MLCVCVYIYIYIYIYIKLYLAKVCVTVWYLPPIATVLARRRPLSMHTHKILSPLSRCLLGRDVCGPWSDKFCAQALYLNTVPWGMGLCTTLTVGVPSVCCSQLKAVVTPLTEAWEGEDLPAVLGTVARTVQTTTRVTICNRTRKLVRATEEVLNTD